jgi:trigger factor
MSTATSSTTSDAPAPTIELNHVTVERGEDGLATLQIEVAPEAVRKMRESVLRDYARRIRVPGFRPGKAPANIVRRNVGDETIAQRVSDELVPQAYQQAIEQNSLHPLERAEVDQLTFDAFDGEKPLQFTARAIMRPDFEMGELTGLHVERTPVVVTDDDVDAALEELRAEHATAKNVEDRGAREGDILNAELQVFIGGEPRTEEPERLRAFVLGDSSFTPSIDEHLIGAQLDEERRFNVTYPSDYHDAELAGPHAEFLVKVTAIKERVLPDLDDAFAQHLKLENLEQLRSQLREMVQHSRRREAEQTLRDELTQVAVDSTDVEAPSRLIQQRAQSRFQGLENELQTRGATLEQYLESTSRTREDIESEIRSETEAEIKRELVLDALVEREKLPLSREEVENHYLLLARMLERPVEEVVQHVDVQDVSATILRRKAVDWLLQHADIQGEEPAEAQAGELETTPEAALAEPSEQAAVESADANE